MISKIYFSLLILFSCSVSTFAQGSWTFAAPVDGTGSAGPENARAICTDASGNVYIVGNFNGSGVPTDFDLSSATTNTFTASSVDGYIASYDKNGNFRWKTIVSGTSGDFTVPSGGVCTNGTFVWVSGAANVSAGAPSIISSTNSFTITSPGTGVDAFVAKLNCSNGSIVWQQGFGGTGANDFAEGICIDPNGCCYVIGAYSSTFTLGSITAPVPGGASDFFIAKFNPAGTMIRFNAGGSTTTNDMIGNGGGICYVPGVVPVLVATGQTSASPANFGAFTGLGNFGLNDALLVELDTTLNYTNALVMGTAAADELMGITYDPYSGGVFVSGFCSGTITFPGTPALTGLGAQDIIIARYNVTTNNFTWSSIAGGTGSERGWGLASDARGGILLCGYTGSPTCNFGGSVSIPSNAGASDLFVVHYTPTGTPVWVLTAAGTGSEEARSIASFLETVPSTVQYLYVTGLTTGANCPFGATTVGNDGGSDFFLARIRDNTPPLLPLHLLSFSGSRQSDMNRLIWQTANEENTKWFELQSSSNGNNFITIATLSARGNGDNRYTYIDSRAFSDKVYYRLKMVDQDGKFTYSSIILIRRNTEAGITVYPSPVKDMAAISGAVIGTKLVVTDVNGKMLQTIPITQSSFTLNMSKYPAGLYFIKTENGIAHKIIKE